MEGCCALTIKEDFWCTNEQFRVALWRNGRVLDLRSRSRGFDSRVVTLLRNDYGQVAHTCLPQRRQSLLLYGVVKRDLYLYLLQTNGLLNVTDEIRVDNSPRPWSWTTITVTLTVYNVKLKTNNSFQLLQEILSKNSKTLKYLYNTSSFLLKYFWKVNLNILNKDTF